jgi:hypothetical protein
MLKGDSWMSKSDSCALSGRQQPPAAVSNTLGGSVPIVSRALALEVLESCAVGDHTFHSLPGLRAVRGFQQLIWSALFRTKAATACTLPSSQVVLVAANPVAHGARLVASIRNSVRSSSFSVMADARLGAQGLLIEHSFPGISAKSLVGFVSGQRLAFALKLRLKIQRGTPLLGSKNRFYREYLFAAQAVRYAACSEAVTKMSQVTVLVTDYDRSAYARPWVWAANSIGMKTVTMMHGSPNEANYVPVLARHSLVWGAVQKQWIEHRSPGIEVQVVGRPDLQSARLSRSSTSPHVVLCHSRERLSLSETESLITNLSRFRNDGHSITLRLHPSAIAADLDDRWKRVASLAQDIVVSRGSFVSSLSSSDLVVCVASSSAVEAIAAGVPAVVIADDSRSLPSDLEAIRSSSREVLREFAAQDGVTVASTPHLDTLASQILEATGARAGHLVDVALVQIRTGEKNSAV